MEPRAADSPVEPAPPFRPVWTRFVTGLALVWFAGLLAFSWARWRDFGFGTFDLAFYLQSLWGFCNGVWEVSLLGVPMLGNHADWIVLLLVPIYALWPHAMVPVIAQIAALAAMAPLGLAIARDLGLPTREAALLALGLLLTPACAFVATHEFHPEALVPVFLLCLYRAEQRGSLPGFILSVLGLLACKENTVLLLVAWLVVRGFQRGRAGEGWARLARWYLPTAVAGLAYLALYVAVLSPRWNSGLVDYWNLYAHLGATPREALGNLFTNPGIWLGAAWRGATQGTVVYGVLLPMLLLPLLRPGWFLVAAPIFSQHLLSWRSSEWMITNHYPAPLIAIFWLATAEALAAWRNGHGPLGRWPRATRLLPAAILGACLLCTFWIGLPSRPQTIAELTLPRHGRLAPEQRRDLLDHASIDPTASIIAPLPYQSHLANRRELYSTHLLLKGLNTLSNSRWEPPAKAYVLILDFGDRSTFDPGSGFYHPRWRGQDGTHLPSSDELVATWLAAQPLPQVLQRNELAILSWSPGPKTIPPRPSPLPEGPRKIGDYELRGLTWPAQITQTPGPAHFLWHKVDGAAVVPLPWVDLVLLSPQATGPQRISKGWILSGPAQAADSEFTETWELVKPPNLPPGTYRAFLEIYDRRLRVFPDLGKDPKVLEWQGLTPEIHRIDLGEMHLVD